MATKKAGSYCDGFSSIEWTRREFIRAATAGTAGIALAGPLSACSSATAVPRAGAGNLFMQGDKPLLIVVEGGDLQRMLQAGIEALGGLRKLVSGKKVVLKPNVVASQPPPVTTDVDLLLAVGDMTRREGALSLTACDANSSGVSKAGKFDALGFPARLKEAGIALDAVDFGDRLAHVFVQKPQWLAHPKIGVVRTLHEADVVINLPMIKRHDASRFTCALKNHFGSVYGPLRFVAHNKLKAEGGEQYFDRALAEFADAVRPELNIVDGRTLLIRSGPTLSGRAEIKEGVNRIILCGDMLAAEVYCSKLMEEHDDSYSSDMIENQLDAAERLGLGIRDLRNVAIKEIVA
ncbi:MAG: DUF362 domain-containing protein [Candidatus Abyssobacteria bacterium SURF_5]|uniref:DUF362 domain-containing protein n=1 Tax=Abyssobacteria bacterium (strain SURF_5) TaxID=2093360 RepID=A0A3A4NTK3_ABYX5|nr:MAG: DUF362 domain-containing protein [Candidatus Abyssubacteria bacterium SURF_5]